MPQLDTTTNILITGVAGFIGFNLATRLLQNGHLVYGIDDLSTGQPQHVTQLSKCKNFKFCKQSITSPLTNLVPHCELIYNLACPASPKFYQQMPLHTLMSNSLGMLHILELAKQFNACVIQSSTSEIYGEALVRPQIENYWGNVNPIGPRSCYDEGKRFAESLCTNFAQEHNLDVRIVRIFNTYGPGMRTDDGRVVSNFITQALQKQPLSIFGSGQQTRSLCFIDDLVDGLILLAKLPQHKYFGPINLGNPEEINVLELATQICQLLKLPLQVKYLPLPTDDPTRRCPDITLAKALLAWQPTTSLLDGLKKTIQAYQRQQLLTT